ncbi:solute carrier family 41 member 1-like isoform X1 [Stegodyphus dumicola]|uniref:solute carrier family 41 member 1-like isoform X1 n=2 Tax=Stegodyphus dumicola TaxID=202533 RepID=UPI0015AB4B38|nr:solute carrier family 41 member 1-like isoform X1 [Stegodyphus dumicola]XP_035216503.1 solute carrier family 41 member 1-like isoform X1 [Stegodyphus dumicola]
MQNQCLKLQGSGSSCEAGVASTTNEASGHPEAARTLQPCCSQALVDKHRRASHVHRIKGLFLEDHIFRLSLLLAPKMVTQAIMEGGLSNSANAGADSEQAELLALTVSCGDEESLHSPESVANILPPDTVNDNLLIGTVNETYEGSIKDGSVDLNDDKDHSDIILTMEDGGTAKKEDLPSTESLRALVFQVFIPFLIAGCGTVAAGIVLDIVQTWPVFENVTQLFILVPALLGLKGNLEMTLAARISTQANLGQLDSLREQWKMTYGNMALVQCQATIVAFLASVFAIVVDVVQEHKFDVHHATLLCASSLMTAAIASLVLGFITVGVVLLSRKLHINPDNVATPIAASLGDVTTLGLLASISSVLYGIVLTENWVAPFLIVLFLLLVPLWVVIAKKNKFTKQVLYTGWLPVISAVFISSAGGCVLDLAIAKFKGIAVFQPVINGVGGNLVAVQSSRISTYLHQKSEMGTLPLTDPKICINPFTAFFGKGAHARSGRVLLLMALPGHLIFAYLIRLLNGGKTTLTPLFLLVYLTVALIQVFLLIYIAYCMIHWMWRRKIDPDNSAIPYLTALGDLLGTSLLALAFLFLFYVGDHNPDIAE